MRFSKENGDVIKNSEHLTKGRLAAIKVINQKAKDSK